MRRMLTRHSAADLSSFSPYLRSNAFFKFVHVLFVSGRLWSMSTHHFAAFSINLFPRMKYKDLSDQRPRPDSTAPCKAKSTRSIRVDTETFGEGVNIGSSRSLTLLRRESRSGRRSRSRCRPRRP
ncbi:hypothetical protein PF007_g18132 [Phytophthora fragariae]|uniref:Uncharacterized protein n=1 Tax=Phytophthora fragariae TaxID=53985 RepID=A0A6A3RB09_9STRA|nr:hypothetical protein PF003_g22784 [Phytophthora fragariae]KAE9093424.1 hypothetical protein PF007_g18132 [Phytophthora fragariae]